MIYFNFNGKIYKQDTAIVGPENRGLRYGDGLFETIKYKNNELILGDEHFARLWKGMKLLKFEIPRLFTAENLQEQILLLLKKNNHTTARIRLSVIRSDGGLFDAKNHHPNYIIQTWQISTELTSLNENGLQLCIYSDAIKMADQFCNIKHNNYLPYFMGAIYAKEQQCNDAVILNDHNRICDSSIANIFIIKDKVISTPSLNEGCVSGIMRKLIIQQSFTAGYEIMETEITREMLLEADEVFLTNSIFNIRWVAAIEQKKYSNTITRHLFDQLRKTNAAVFC